MTPVIEARSVSIAIAGRQIVRNVSFVLEPGRTLGLVGETGSGKSMTCRAFVGLLDRLGGDVYNGEVLVGGADFSHAPQSRWNTVRGRQIGFIPQASMSSLNPFRRIGGQLQETVSLFQGGAASRDAALELLTKVRLPKPSDVARLYAHELSGGMKQRVMIALSLAGTPNVLIADEPTTALDVTIQREILDLLQELRSSSGLAILLVTHDLGVVESLCDDIMVMYAGSIVEAGPTSEVLAEPTHPYTRALLDARPHFGTTEPLVALPGSPPDPAARPAGCQFRLRCSRAQDDCMQEPELLSVTELPDRSAACWHPIKTSPGRP